MNELAGQVALVTGAGRGIGRAHVLALAAAGAAVVVNDRGAASDGGGQDTVPAADVVAEIEAAGGRAVVSTHDVADFDGAAALVETALEHFGGLDAVITNAGILRDRTIAAMSEAEWDDVIRVHLKGTFAVARHAAAYWRERAKGGDTRPATLLTTTSASGLYGNAGQANYGAAKAGVAAFTVIAAQELARYGVTVNCLAPSALTRLTEPHLPAEGLDETRRRELDPTWVARVAVWLCGPAARHVTGRVFDVRGPQVGVSSGWAVDRFVDQPPDADGLDRTLSALVADAPAPAGMDGLRPAGAG